MSNLRKIRKNLNISMEKIAKILNLTYQQIQRYETGASKLNEDQIRILCSYLRCSSDYLLGIIDIEKKPYEFTEDEEKKIKEVLEKNADYLKELIKK